MPRYTIDGPDLARLRGAIEPFDTPAERARYVARDFPRAHIVRDLDRRYRWDLFWRAHGMEQLTGAYPGDAHIDTALRRIVAPLES